MLDGIDVKHRHPAVFTVDKLIHSQSVHSFPLDIFNSYNIHSKCLKYIEVYISSHHIQKKVYISFLKDVCSLLLLLVVELWELNLRILML